MTGLNEFSGAVALKHGTLNVTTIGDPPRLGISERAQRSPLAVLEPTHAVLIYGGATATASRSLVMNDNGGTLAISTAGHPDFEQSGRWRSVYQNWSR
jgi:hypothetical protein